MGLHGEIQSLLGETWDGMDNNMILWESSIYPRWFNEIPWDNPIVLVG